MLKHVDECNLEHPKIPSKPRLLSRGEIQGFFDFDTEKKNKLPPLGGRQLSRN